MAMTFNPKNAGCPAGAPDARDCRRGERLILLKLEEFLCVKPTRASFVTLTRMASAVVWD
jgi:hypothetical protein